MKTRYGDIWPWTCRLVIGLVAAGLFSAQFAVGQDQLQDRQHEWPDTLEMITVTGSAMVDTDGAHPKYALDEDDDGAADYRLSFGPWWYESPSGAVRPEDGQEVTITGALQVDTLSVILVFEIDGLVWRIPSAYGSTGYLLEEFWVAPTVQPVTETGVVFVDTTYFYDHYYLDTTGDSIPEYQLGFGPSWFEPESGAVRPADGDTVTVVGVRHERDGIDLLAVYEIDGLVWREFSEPAPWAGKWIKRTGPDSVEVFCMNCANREQTRARFRHGQMGPNWPDSMFVQFWEIPPDSAPGLQTQHRFMAFFFDVHDPLQNRLMNGQFGEHQQRMRFQQEHRIQIRYYAADLAMRDLEEEDLEVQFWDAEQSAWLSVDGIEVDALNDLISFESVDLASYYSLFAPNLVTAVEPPSEAPERFELAQNYPNPFNPTTVIPFKVSRPGAVLLEVYDVLGRRLATLIDERLEAGVYEVQWDGTNAAGVAMAGGIYLYRLKAADFQATRAMVFVK